jgi:hypothetical protein
LLDELVEFGGVGLGGGRADRAAAERADLGGAVGDFFDGLEAGVRGLGEIERAIGVALKLDDLALLGFEVEHAADGGGIVLGLADAEAGRDLVLIFRLLGAELLDLPHDTLGDGVGGDAHGEKGLGCAAQVPRRLTTPSRSSSMTLKTREEA